MGEIYTERYQERMNLLVDSHSHWIPQEIVNNSSFFDAQWSDISALIKIMDKEGIEKAVLTYPNSDAHLKIGWLNLCEIYNQEIARVIREHSGRFVGAAVIPFGDKENMLDKFKKAMDLGLKALSLASSYFSYYLDDEEFYPIYEEAQKIGIPIFIHPQVVNTIGADRVQDPLLTPAIQYTFDLSICIGKLIISGIFDKFPKINFIFSHLGGALPLLKDRIDTLYTTLRQKQAIKDLGKLPSEILKNVYVDTTGATSKSIIKLALEIFGVEKVIWGSDYPSRVDVKETIDTIRQLDLKEEEKALILYGNINRILK